MIFYRSLSRYILIGMYLAILISIALDYTHDVRPVRVREAERTDQPVRPEVVYGRR